MNWTEWAAAGQIGMCFWAFVNVVVLIITLLIVKGYADAAKSQAKSTLNLVRQTERQYEPAVIIRPLSREFPFQIGQFPGVLFRSDNLIDIYLTRTNLSNSVSEFRLLTRSWLEIGPYKYNLTADIIERQYRGRGQFVLLNRESDYPHFFISMRHVTGNNYLNDSNISRLISYINRGTLHVEFFIDFKGYEAYEKHQPIPRFYEHYYFRGNPIPSYLTCGAYYVLPGDWVIGGRQRERYFPADLTDPPFPE